VQEKGEEVADGVETYLPEISVLKGLEVTENGDIYDKEGNVIGRISEGDPADLVGMTLNEEGEILDEVSSSQMIIMHEDTNLVDRMAMSSAVPKPFLKKSSNKPKTLPASSQASMSSKVSRSVRMVPSKTTKAINSARSQKAIPPTSSACL
jgi:hypothetical protein